MSDQIEQEYFNQIARIGKAFSNSHRINLLYYLAQCERTVENLAKLARLSIANTSQHLQTLRHTGLVTSRKQAQHVFYRLTDQDCIIELLLALQQLGIGTISEVGNFVETHFARDEEYEPESKDGFLKAVEDGKLVVLDVRPLEEFSAGHLAGAINIPLEILDREQERLPSDRCIVVYCRGRYCLMSQEAVRRLRKQGIEAKRLRHGLPELRMAGYPVVNGGNGRGAAQITM